MQKKNKLYCKKNCYKKEINLETKRRHQKIERVKKKDDEEPKEKPEIEENK